jgi:hypothetical protein
LNQTVSAVLKKALGFKEGLREILRSPKISRILRSVHCPSQRNPWDTREVWGGTWSFTNEPSEIVGALGGQVKPREPCTGVQGAQL